MFKPQYYYLENGRVVAAPKIVVQAIGVRRYEDWKDTKVFYVHDSLSALDFIIHSLGSGVFDMNDWLIIEALIERYNIGDFYISVYLLSRKVQMKAYKGNYVAYLDNYIGIDGVGNTPLMALVDLHREFKTDNIKSFIP